MKQELIRNIYNREFKVGLKTPTELYIKRNTQTAQLPIFEISQNISRDCILLIFVFHAESFVQ